ncbi:nucleolar protein 4-like [Tigriopus californicus]|nr:nucleolar protein 4-like [Tigriopus californicus]XP_059089879.1 nucleolar protein 4-like [Tigriopus californicus]
MSESSPKSDDVLSVSSPSPSPTPDEEPNEGSTNLTNGLGRVDVPMSEVSPSPTPTPPPSQMHGQSPSAPPTNSLTNLSMAAAKQLMLEQYTPWVMSTYGDTAKTKTIVARKYARIVALLKSMERDSAGGAPGSEQTGSEAAKFRLWVKSKGFHLGAPAGHPDSEKQESKDMLYLPTGTDKTVDGSVHFVYKKVAMVEQFFDIIYSVHVEAAANQAAQAAQAASEGTTPPSMRGRAGKHCGQKRTYRAVADQYAFIPREAISKFLLFCIDCQRKNSMEHRRTNNNGNVNNANNRNDENSSPITSIGTPTPNDYRPLSPPPSLVIEQFRQHTSPGLQGSVPLMSTPHLSPPSTPKSSSSSPATSSALTAAALSHAMAAIQNHPLRSLHMRNTLLASTPFVPTQALLTAQGGNPAPYFGPNSAGLLNPTTGLSKFNPGDIDLSLPITSTYLRRMRAFDQLYRQFNGGQASNEKDDSGSNDPDGMDNAKIEVDGSENGGSNPSQNGSWTTNGSMLASEALKNGTSQLSALLTQGQNGHGGHGAQSPNTGDHNPQSGQISSNQSDGSSHIHDDNSSVGAKDDDDDDDDDDCSDDKLEVGDPEKLKSFNMFVRLFVDENLDRHVPISRQPKEKIQAIIDSCTRQFPEHANRARKRIRTYLKSCRRTKRTREQAGLDSPNTRPTPPHLTSAQAEQLLARACENEAENAKRMRMGLEPVSQPMPILTSAPTIDVLSCTSSTGMVSSAGATLFTAANGEKQLKTEYKSEQLASLLAAQPMPMVSTDKPAFLNGGLTNTSMAMYRQVPFPQVVSSTGATMTFPGTQALLQQSQALQTAGLTNGTSLEGLKKPPLLNHKLNVTEIGAVRQLITGYRESAAFLLRSADELENLLTIQPKL